MKHSRFTDEQIIGFLKQAGMSVKERCRSGGFSLTDLNGFHRRRLLNRHRGAGGGHTSVGGDELLVVG